MVPAPAAGRLDDRLGIPAVELSGYGLREQTRTGHLRQIMTCAGRRMLDAPGSKELDEFLFARAMEHDSPIVSHPDLGCTPSRWLETGATTFRPTAVKTELAYLRRLDALFFRWILRLGHPALAA